MRGSEGVFLETNGGCVPLWWLEANDVVGVIEVDIPCVLPEKGGGVPEEE